MTDNKNGFPSIKKSIDTFIQDEDGSITRSKLITIGSLMIILGSIYSLTVHADHSSHQSHSSHSSTSYYRGHVSHTSHTSHTSSATHGSHGSHSNTVHSNHSSSTHSAHSNAPHNSHSSHTSHSNTSTHSNSHYSYAGDYTGPTAPDINTIKPIKSPQTNILIKETPTILATAELPDTKTPHKLFDYSASETADNADVISNVNTEE